MNETRLEVERPFALIAIGWLTAAVGFMLVVGTLYRVTSGRADSTARIALAVGVVELLIGAFMGFGARWAYWPIRILTPINFVIAVMTTIVGSTSLILWAVLFGLATLVLWGPDRLVGRFQVAIRRWRAHQPVVVGPSTVTPEAAPERMAA
jgi:hypothetical protein